VGRDGKQRHELGDATVLADETSCARQLRDVSDSLRGETLQVWNGGREEADEGLYCTEVSERATDGLALGDVLQDLQGRNLTPEMRRVNNLDNAS